VAAREALGGREEEGVADVPVRVVTQERPADDGAVPPREVGQKPRGEPVWRQRVSRQLRQEPHAGGEELRQDDPLGAFARGRVGEALARRQVRPDVADHGLKLNSRHAHLKPHLYRPKKSQAAGRVV